MKREPSKYLKKATRSILEDVGIEAQEVPKHFNPYPNNRHNGPVES